MMGLKVPRECPQQGGFAAGYTPLDHRRRSAVYGKGNIVQGPTGLPRITKKNMVR
jgi:hypothetical protein